VHHRGLIIVVLFENCLDRVTPQQKVVLLNSLLIFPIVIVNMLLIKIVLRSGRYKRWHHLFVLEVLPRKVTEPGMRFDFRIAIETETIRWFSLKTLKIEELKDLFLKDLLY
jgi:hypothetical protein